MYIAVAAADGDGDKHQANSTKLWGLTATNVASGCGINSHMEGDSSRPKGQETLAHSVGKVCIIVFLMMVSISIPGY
jgi:hypothetical protein